MNEGKRKAIEESNKQRFLKKFGTLDIKELLGDDVLTLKKSIHDRLLEFGDSHTSHWIKTYLPDDLKWLIPYQKEFKRHKQIETRASRVDEYKRTYLLETFGTTDVESILGEAVLRGEQSLFSRFKELGKYTPSQTTRFVETYASDEIKSRLYPFLQEAEDLFYSNYNEEMVSKMSEQAKKAIIMSYAKYGRASFSSFTEKENKEFLNSLSIEPLEPVPSTTRGVKFRGKCLLCGHVNLFNFQSNRIPTVCPYCNESGKTRIELAIQIALEREGFHVSPKERSIIKSEEGRPQEIDLYLPDLNIGFEINGALTHNSGINPFAQQPKHKDYHKRKTEQALAKGIRLYHIWEHWEDHIDLVKLVLAKCRVFNKTFQARKLTLVVNPDILEVNTFLNNNHKQGFCKTSLSLALYDEETMVQYIGFVISDDVAELVRNATLQGAQVIGGIFKLFKHSLQILKNLGVKSIVTFADRDLTPDQSSSVYSRLGFTFVGDVGQTMSYYVFRNRSCFEKQVYNRRFFQKKYLKDRLSRVKDWKFDEKETELQNLARAGIYPIFNSGCFKFVYLIN